MLRFSPEPRFFVRSGEIILSGANRYIQLRCLRSAGGGFAPGLFSGVQKESQVTDKKLKKLSRSELLELLIAQTKRAERLEKELEAAKAELVSRNIAVSESGTMAEAALKLNGVFAAADAAAKQYLNNIRSESAGAETSFAEREEESRRKAEEIIRAAEEQARAREAEADAYWETISMRYEQLKAGGRPETNPPENAGNGEDAP